MTTYQQFKKLHQTAGLFVLPNVCARFRYIKKPGREAREHGTVLIAGAGQSGEFN